jgi:hypothetical protein
MKYLGQRLQLSNINNHFENAQNLRPATHNYPSPPTARGAKSGRPATTYRFRKQKLDLIHKGVEKYTLSRCPCSVRP